MRIRGAPPTRKRPMRKKSTASMREAISAPGELRQHHVRTLTYSAAAEIMEDDVLTVFNYSSSYSAR
jgi:hypothetical protein